VTGRILALAVAAALTLALTGCAGGEGVVMRVRGVVTDNLHGSEAPARQVASAPSVIV